MHELHHEEQLAGLGGAAVEHAGDDGVVHQGERLSLGVEASEDRARVHADYLTADASASRDRANAQRRSAVRREMPRE